VRGGTGTTSDAAALGSQIWNGAPALEWDRLELTKSRAQSSRRHSLPPAEKVSSPLLSYSHVAMPLHRLSMRIASSQHLGFKL
jgi:hypothetical protein